MKWAEGFYFIIFISQQKAVVANLSYFTFTKALQVTALKSNIYIKDTQATKALPFIHAYNNARNF
jgi:hypothetical protein